MKKKLGPHLRAPGVFEQYVHDGADENFAVVTCIGLDEKGDKFTYIQVTDDGSLEMQTCSKGTWCKKCVEIIEP